MIKNQGCGRMYCVIERCGRIDDSYTAYCSKHGKSHHVICGEGNSLCPVCRANNHKQKRNQSLQIDVKKDDKTLSNLSSRGQRSQITKGYRLREVPEEADNQHPADTFIRLNDVLGMFKNRKITKTTLKQREHINQHLKKLIKYQNLKEGK